MAIILPLLIGLSRIEILHISSKTTTKFRLLIGLSRIEMVTEDGVSVNSKLLIGLSRIEISK